MHGFITNSHTRQPGLTNTRGLNTFQVKRQRFFYIQYTLILIKTAPFLLMRNGGVLFTSSFMFSYKTTRHRSVESSRWSPSRWRSIFFLMIRMFWASIACSIVMSFKKPYSHLHTESRRIRDELNWLCKCFY